MILRTLLLLLLADGLRAQVLPVVVYNIGYVEEEQLPYVYHLSVFNPFEKLLAIDSVETPCACLSIAEDLLALAPKSWETLRVEIHTLKVGSFEKTFTLRSAHTHYKQDFVLQGFLLPKIAASSHYFEKNSEKMRLLKTALHLQTTHGLVAVDSFIVYNTSTDTLYFSSTNYVPSYLHISFAPRALAPQTIGAWRIRGMGAQRLRARYQLDKIQVQVQTSSGALQHAEVFVGSEEATLATFSLSDPKKPSLHIDTLVASVEQPVFLVENRGRQTLRIDHIRSSCACVSMNISTPIDLEALESVPLSFSICKSALSKSHTLEIYSNDPQKSVQKLWLLATQ